MEATYARTVKLKRASKPRSRAGCLTCRGRHVKCDETRPSCGKCNKMSLRCVYATESPTVTLESEGGAMACLPVLIYSLPFSVPGNPTDRKAIHYYHNVVASSLSGFKQSDFYFRFVLQRSETEPVVRMAVIALSHAHLEHGSRPKGLSFIAARHQTKDSTLQDVSQPADEHSDVTAAYNRAIRKLRLYMQNTAQPCRTVVLLCAIIFYIIETLRHDFAAAEKHADNGIAIISQWRKDLRQRQECHVPEDMDRLLTMYAALDLGATMASRDRPPQIATVRAFEEECGGNCSGTLLQPCRYDDAEQALSWSINLTHGVWAFLGQYESLRKVSIDQVPEDVVEQKRELEDGLRLWVAGAEQLKRAILAPRSSRGKALSRAEKNSELLALAVGETQCLCGKWLLAESLQDDCNHHLCDEDAETAFMLAERFILHIRQRNAVPADARLLYASRVFTSFGHFVQTMLILLHRTRVPAIRAKAVALVKELDGLEDLSSFRILFPDWDAEQPTSCYLFERPTQHKKV